MGPILRLHNRPFVPRVADQCMPGLPRTSVITQSLSAARCNSRTVLLTLPALRGDFVITDIIQNRRLCVAGAMWTRLLKLPLTASVLA